MGKTLSGSFKTTGTYGSYLDDLNPTFFYICETKIKNSLLFVTYLIIVLTTSLSDNNAVCRSVNNLFKIMLMVKKGFVDCWCTLSFTALAICFWGFAAVAGNSLASVSCLWTLSCHI